MVVHTAGRIPFAKKAGESARECGRQGDRRKVSEIRPFTSLTDVETKNCTQPGQLFTTDHCRSRPTLMKNEPKYPVRIWTMPRDAKKPASSSGPKTTWRSHKGRARRFQILP